MKTYLEKLVELYHEFRVYDIALTELAVCVKSFDELPDAYMHIKSAARESQVTTITRLSSLLITAEREETSQIVMQHNPQTLNSEFRQPSTHTPKIRQ